MLLVGNLHAALLEHPQIAGRPPSINIAVGGITARGCATRLARLDTPARTDAAVLIIGTNDVARRRRPERPATGRRFEADVRRILAILGNWSGHVFVAAVPPLGPEAADHDADAVVTFSERLEQLCAEKRHVFFDPFAGIRTSAGGRATTGLFSDDIHLADYVALAGEIDRVVGSVLDRDRRSQQSRERAGVVG
ncbi:SGNH/GDSL hydrolase family protein [Methylobacterium sp. E-065]|uniref:SGNH/GDSL hydrolase family protein n=1 Tax=Methylobacterium sp. E-065 TaxID=2836583 RepID=UPI001FB985D0|nr:SGNH/GDSL hydrolase family protein [Methylobacterium sp. E-065]MCJ2020672.1 SGNH/GDSL hydrolase family protein [Methylobacterium sp. E-065]